MDMVLSCLCVLYIYVYIKHHPYHEYLTQMSWAWRIRTTDRHRIWYSSRSGTCPSLIGIVANNSVASCDSPFRMLMRYRYTSLGLPTHFDQHHTRSLPYVSEPICCEQSHLFNSSVPVICEPEDNTSLITPKPTGINTFLAHATRCIHLYSLHWFV